MLYRQQQQTFRQPNVVPAKLAGLPAWLHSGKQALHNLPGKQGLSYPILTRQNDLEQCSNYIRRNAPNGSSSLPGNNGTINARAQF